MTKYGTPRRLYSDDEKQRAVELAKEVGTSKAARFLDMPLSTVSNWFTAAVYGGADAETTEPAADDESREYLANAIEANRAVIAANSKAVFDLQKTAEDLRATLDATRRELVVFNTTADELKTELRNLKTAVELLTETLLDTAQEAAPLIVPTITPDKVTC